MDLNIPFAMFAFPAGAPGFKLLQHPKEPWVESISFWSKW
jgi:hypothetical protein